MNHKRHRPKHQRAGCLLCKPHKDERDRHSKDHLPRQERLAPTIAAGLDDRDEEWLIEDGVRYACVAGSHCEECGEPFVEHIEHEGPLRAPLIDLARVA